MENVADLLQRVKGKLKVTWQDESTDRRITEMIEDAQVTLNHKLGAEIDYSAPGMERNLFLNYCLYAWNDCVNEFDNNYINEIYQIRNKYKVKRYVEKKEEL